MAEASVTMTEPTLIYGTGTLWFKDGIGDPSSVHRPTVEGIKAAIEAGYRYLDGAEMYGTERELGVAMTESGVPRSEFSLTTKADGVDDIEGRLERSLAKLKTDYVDLYLIHSPFPASSPKDLQDAWLGMERCLGRGLAKKIGVSNFSIRNMEAILQIATVKPAINQIEMHPLLFQADLYAYLQANDISLQGYGTLLPLKNDLAEKTMSICQKIAGGHGVSEAAVLQRWILDQGASVITTSSKKERLAQMLKESTSFRLTTQQVKELTESASGQKVRGFFAEDFAAAEDN